MRVKQRDLDIVLSSPANWHYLQNKKVLVTGATGRLGIYIVNAVLAASKRWQLNVQVLALARSKQKLEEAFVECPEGLRMLAQDVTVPIQWDGDVDYIFHTAGLASPEDFTFRPVETLWGHVQGTRNVLEVAKTKRARKVLYASTIEVYGAGASDIDIQETDMGTLMHTNSRACYPEAKRLCETMFSCYKEQHGVDYAAVRMSHTIGPGISLYDGRAFAEFIRNVVEGRDIVLQTSGGAVRTYTYVADTVGAMFLALLNGTEEYYNVAAEENQISIRDLAELIASMDPTDKAEVRFGCLPDEQLAYLPFKLGILDSARMRALGWQVQVDLERAFRWTLESFLK